MAFDQDAPFQADDWAQRNLISNVEKQDQRIADIERLLNGYREQLYSAFDEGYSPTQYLALIKRVGAWPGIVGGTTGSYPFQITTRVNPSVPGAYQAMVNPDSDLLLSIEPNNWQAITGMGAWFDLLNTAPLTFSGSTPSGFYCYDIIVLYIAVTSYAVTGANIQSRVVGSNDFDPTLVPWDTSDLAVLTNNGAMPPIQTGVNFMLGYTVQPTDAGTAPPTVIQACSNHLMIQNTYIAGEPCLFPIPAPYRRFGLTAN